MVAILVTLVRVLLNPTCNYPRTSEDPSKLEGVPVLQEQ